MATPSSTESSAPLMAFQWLTMGLEQRAYTDGSVGRKRVNHRVGVVASDASAHPLSDSVDHTWHAFPAAVTRFPEHIGRLSGATSPVGDWAYATLRGGRAALREIVPEQNYVLQSRALQRSSTHRHARRGSTTL